MYFRFGVECVGQSYGLDGGILHGGVGIPFAGIEIQVTPGAPFVACVPVAGIQIEIPGIGALPRYDIHHSAHGVGSVESRRGPLDDLYLPGIPEIQAVIIYIVHSLSGKALPVNKKQDGASAEAAHVEGCLLAHRISELESRQLFGQKILDIRRVGPRYLIGGNDTCDHRHILERFRRASRRDDDLVQESVVRI